MPVLFPRHLTAQRRAEVISHIQTFRDYFHYHIKASKAYIHSRMRKRTADFLKGRCIHAVYRVIILIKPQCYTAPGQRRRRKSGRRPAAGPSRYNLEKGRLALVDRLCSLGTPSLPSIWGVESATRQKMGCDEVDRRLLSIWVHVIGPQ